MVAFASTQASECINSRDPIGEAGGANLYAYAENDPINKRDLWGLRPSRLDGYESVFFEAHDLAPFHVVGDEEPPSDEARAVPAFDDLFHTTEGSPIDDNRSSAESTAFSDFGGSGGGSASEGESASGTEGSSDGSEEEEEKAERNEKAQGEETDANLKLVQTTISLQYDYLNGEKILTGAVSIASSFMITRPVPSKPVSDTARRVVSAFSGVRDVVGAEAGGSVPVHFEENVVGGTHEDLNWDSVKSHSIYGIDQPLDGNQSFLVPSRNESFTPRNWMKEVTTQVFNGEFPSK